MRAALPIATLVLAAVFAGGTLSGCALKTPPTHSEVLDQALPARTRIPPTWKADSIAHAVADDWLRSFNDPALDAIVAEAIAHNLDLRQAAEKVRIAQQNVVVVGAQLLPQIGVQLGANVTRDNDQSSNYYSTLRYAGVAWELDVWGRLRAQRAAAEAGFEATALDYAYARQSLAALVAKTWYLTIEARQLVRLGEQAVKVYEDLLALVTIRRSAGKDSDLDVVDVRAKLETAQSQLESAREAYGEARRALEVLLGRYPAAEIEVAAAYPRLPPPVGAGVPASLLERRPDIIAAERAVLAAFRQQEAASLALLPDFSISLLGGRLGDQVLSLLRLNPWLASAGIGVSIPIYEGGALRAQVEIATAEQAQAVARYGAVALAAFREVENALANEQLLAKRVPFEERALADRTAAVRIATIQYKAGRRDLLWVAELQTAQLANEAAVIKLHGIQGANRIRLHLALGGSFDAAPAMTLPTPIAAPQPTDGGYTGAAAVPR
jgi:outer membrane protein, multidrug efflux system